MLLVKAKDEHGYELILIRFRNDGSVSMMDSRLGTELKIDLADPKFKEIKAIEFVREE